MTTIREAKLKIDVTGNAAKNLAAIGQEVGGLKEEAKEAKKALDKVEKAIDETALSADDAAENLGEVAEQVADVADEAKDAAKQVDKLSDKLDEVGDEAKAAAKKVKLFGVEVDETALRSKTAGSSLSSLGSLGRAAFGMLPGPAAMATASITAVTAAAAAVAAGLTAAVMQASEFSSAMSRVRAATQGSAADMATLREQAEKLGASTMFSSADVARVQENFAKAGFTIGQTVDAVPAALSLATATDTDTGFSSGLLSQVISSTGMRASDSGDIADLLVTAANASNVDATDLAETFKYAAPVFSSMNQGERIVAAQDLSALSGILGDQGIRGSMAGTSLRAAYAQLSAPTKRGKEAMQRIGLSTVDENGNTRRLPEIIDDLRGSLEGMGTAERSDTLRDIFGVEASTAIAAILEAPESRFNELTSAMEASSGMAERTARIMQDNLGGDIEQLGGAMGGLAVTIGSQLEPGIRTSAQSITDFVGALNQALIDSGLASTTFGSMGSAIATMTDGMMIFLTTVAPKIASWMETIGLIEDGEAKKFAEAMANATTDLAKARLETDIERKQDELTMAERGTRLSLQAVSGRVSGAQGRTGDALATDITARLRDLGLEDLGNSAQAKAALDQLRGQGALTDAQRRDALAKVNSALAPDVQSRLDSGAQQLQRDLAQTDLALQSGQRQIEDTRSGAVSGAAESAEQTFGQRSLGTSESWAGVASAGAAAPAMAIGKITADILSSWIESTFGDGPEKSEKAAGEQIGVLRSIDSVLQRIGEGIVPRGDSSGGE